MHALTSKIELIGESDRVKLSSGVAKVIEVTAEEYDFDYMTMNSGAVHNAAMMARLTDVWLIFIPSMGGKSHCPEEYTSEEDVKVGCDLLLDIVNMRSNGNC